VLPGDANPSIADPPSGIIVNANDRPTQDPRVVGYMGDWDPGFRATYIAQRLVSTAKADLAAMPLLQTDFTSPPVARFREAILAASPTTQRARDAQAAVRAWDGSLAADSPAAAIYESWLVRMCERVFKDKLGANLYRDYAGGARITFALYQLIGRPNDAWFSEIGDPAVSGRDAVAGRALDDAAKDLASRFGADLTGWRWGDMHPITFAHPLAIGPLAPLLNIGPPKRSGDEYSVNKEAYSINSPFAVTSHPSERMIVDLADLDASLSVTPEGQSGQPGSKYWGDQVKLWAAGEYKPMRFSGDRLGHLDGTLVFRPR